MPTKQFRRRPATDVRDKRFVQRGPDTMDRLAFKYMEMCKVDSSSDSESDMSPRWSDASSKSVQGCADLKRPTLAQKSFGRHYSQPLDPYDGSSEDSASSADGQKRQKHKGLRIKGRGRRVATIPMSFFEVRKPEPRDGVAIMNLTDIQMRSSSDSELKAINQADFIYRASAEMPERPPLYHLAVPFNTATSYQLADESHRSPTHPGTLSKRKLFCSLGDNEEYVHRKKQCVTQMETETLFPEG